MGVRLNGLRQHIAADQHHRAYHVFWESFAPPHTEYDQVRDSLRASPVLMTRSASGRPGDAVDHFPNWVMDCSTQSWLRCIRWQMTSFNGATGS
jgi:hypothetical protein